MTLQEKMSKEMESLSRQEESIKARIKEDTENLLRLDGARKMVTHLAAFVVASETPASIPVPSPAPDVNVSGGE